MNFLHDKHSRYYCIFIVTLVLLLFLMGIAVIDTQTAATKEMFLTHNNAIATSLLEEGISKEVIATALMNTEAGTTGNKFLAEIGLSNSTALPLRRSGVRFLRLLFQFCFQATDTVFRTFYFLPKRPVHL